MLIGMLGISEKGEDGKGIWIYGLDCCNIVVGDDGKLDKCECTVAREMDAMRIGRGILDVAFSSRMKVSEGGGGWGEFIRWTAEWIIIGIGVTEDLVLCTGVDIWHQQEQTLLSNTFRTRALVKPYTNGTANVCITPNTANVASHEEVIGPKNN